MAWIDFDESGILYVLLVGHSWRSMIDGERHKTWDMHIYATERARRQGIGKRYREHPDADLMTLELHLSELVAKAKLTTVVLKERICAYDVLLFLQDKRKKRGGSA